MTPAPSKPWKLGPSARKKLRAAHAASLEACATACLASTGRAPSPRLLAETKARIEALLAEARKQARDEALRDALDATESARDAVPADWTSHEWKYGWKQGASEAFLRVGALIAPELTAGFSATKG